MAKKCGNGCNVGVFSEGLCKRCWGREYGKPLKKNDTPIKKVADKRAEELRLYYIARAEHMKEFPECQLKVDEHCTVVATELHHQKGREGKLLLEKKFFRSGCKPCHDRITEKSKQAIENGQSVSRHKKEDN